MTAGQDDLYLIDIILYYFWDRYLNGKGENQLGVLSLVPGDPVSLVAAVDCADGG